MFDQNLQRAATRRDIPACRALVSRQASRLRPLAFLLGTTNGSDARRVERFRFTRHEQERADPRPLPSVVVLNEHLRGVWPGDCFHTGSSRVGRAERAVALAWRKRQRRPPWVGDCRFRRARHVLSRSAETGHPRPARYGQLPRFPARIITRRSRPACGSGVVRLRCARPVLRPRAEILARSGSVGLTVVSRLPTATAGFSVRWADLVAGLRRARRPGLGRRRRFHPPATAPADRTAGEGAVCP